MEISLRSRLCPASLAFALALLAGPASALYAQAPKPATSEPAAEDAPFVQGPASGNPVPVTRSKSAVGTLVFAHGAATPGGQFTRVLATAAPAPEASANAPANLGYDRFLGPLTMKSLDHVLQAMVAMHHGWPRGQKLQLSFVDRPTPAELEPATLAAALALDSLFRNYDIEPSYAALGVLQADGTVEPVGSIPERLAGAARARVGRIALPSKNMTQVSDFLLSEGIGAFVGTQIFTVQNFNEAGVLALTKLDPKTEEVVKLFGSVQRTLAAAQSGAVGLLRSEGTQSVLQKVLAAAPNHASAQVLLDWGTGKKAVISFNGSVDVIDRRAGDIIRAMRAKQEDAIRLPKEKIAENLAALRFVADRLDPRARNYAAALARFAEALQKAMPAGTSTRAPKLTPAVQAAYETAKQQGNDEWVKLVQARQAAVEEAK